MHLDHCNKIVFTGYCDCIDADECASNPCVNGGTCEDKDNEFGCVCAAGFHGDNCERSMNYVMLSETRCDSTTCSEPLKSIIRNVLSAQTIGHSSKKNAN